MPKNRDYAVIWNTKPLNDKIIRMEKLKNYSQIYEVFMASRDYNTIDRNKYEIM